MTMILVTDRHDTWLDAIQGVTRVDAREYLTDRSFSKQKNLKVCNLCDAYTYKSLGYYVSLLSEARNQRPFPTVRTIQDLDQSSSLQLVPHELAELIDRSFSTLVSERFTLSVYFGQNTAKRYDKLSRQLFNLFQAPLLRFEFRRRSTWQLRRVKAMGTIDIPESHRDFVVQAAENHFRHRVLSSSRRSKTRFDLAILHSPAEGDLAPSNEAALKKMIRAASSLGMAAQLITPQDAGRLLEFDALFIRETTAIDHHTYRLARRAEHEGLVVIDDPVSILRCTNKVFLAELFDKHKVPSPQTVVVHQGNKERIAQTLGFPIVLKSPDSAFSMGVVKVHNEEELFEQLRLLFAQSSLVIAQQYMKTDFDWRIGILEGRGLYACKYHMARGHWQIAKHGEGHKTRWGKCETLPFEMAPRPVVKAALKAASLIGDGLYGVDVKQSEDNAYVIEVNDNPNLDAGTEDAVLRDELYRRIMETFLRRIEKSKM